MHSHTSLLLLKQNATLVYLRHYTAIVSLRASDGVHRDYRSTAYIKIVTLYHCSYEWSPKVPQKDRL